MVCGCSSSCSCGSTACCNTCYSCQSCCSCASSCVSSCAPSVSWTHTLCYTIDDVSTPFTRMFTQACVGGVSFIDFDGISGAVITIPTGATVAVCSVGGGFEP